MGPGMFRGRTLLIATMHKKETVMAPLFERELGVKCIVPKKLNTDLLGTFSGEIERLDDPLTIARKKCLVAMESYEADLAVANEGSFGPHPLIPFAYADDEIIVFIDQKNELQIEEREISTDTNFNGAAIKTENELLEFADRAKFPSHGLILRAGKQSKTDIVKGIVKKEQLLKEFNRFKNNSGNAFAETDMRAMHNPTRMKIIEQLTQKLIDKINSICPGCKTPGFGINGFHPGLPCSLCGLPTRSVLYHIYSCKQCAFTKNVIYPHGVKTEDPMYCDHCNP